MIIYNYHHETGLFLGISEADVSPLEPDVFLIPANATEIAPPSEVAGKTRHFVNNEWQYVDIPVPPVEPPKEEPVLTYIEKRLLAYPPRSDYIDGVVKADQQQIDAYIAACLAVKAKYPK